MWQLQKNKPESLLEDEARALFNILEDFAKEKERSEKLKHEALRLLEDSLLKQKQLQEVHKATLNLLEDMHEKQTTLVQTENAMMNILEDIEKEREKIEESKKLLEAANKELEAFSYSVSHDLQAPLRAISGFSQAIFEDYIQKLDATGQRYLQLVQENCHLMSQLISDLLRFSRLGRQSMHFEEIDMEKLAKRVFDELKVVNPDRKIQFALVPLPKARGDLSMMHQVFVNILSNAIKFTKNRELAVIEVGSFQKEGKNVYYIKDNGAGFDMRYVDKIFGVFQRLHTTTEFEGTGIGLALVKRIIDRHEGTIWIEGAVEQGACVFFTLGEGNGRRSSI